MKEAIKEIIPYPILRLYRTVKLRHRRLLNQQMSVKEVFTHIYKNNEWGGAKGKYCSGSGSSEDHAALYSATVKSFILERGIRTIVDLGCGDFTVGTRTQIPGVKYLGVDIVDDLIDYNQEHFSSADVSFQCLNIITDELPNADVCLIRQVLQHLSNSEILSILGKLKKYKYILITEHYPAPSVMCTPNKDKPHGGDTRIYDDSAVFIGLPPFNVEVSKVILDVDAATYLVMPGERIKTMLIENKDVL